MGRRWDHLALRLVFNFVTIASFIISIPGPPFPSEAVEEEGGRGGEGGGGGGEERRREAGTNQGITDRPAS